METIKPATQRICNTEILALHGTCVTTCALFGFHTLELRGHIGQHSVGISSMIKGMTNGTCGHSLPGMAYLLRAAVLVKGHHEAACR